MKLIKTIFKQLLSLNNHALFLVINYSFEIYFAKYFYFYRYFQLKYFNDSANCKDVKLRWDIVRILVL